MSMRREKMSKSRGNVITIDEVTCGVADVEHGYEFRFADGTILPDYRERGIWRDRPGDSFFYTSTRDGKQPVFLHVTGNPVPALITVDGLDIVQHGNKPRVWDVILQRNGEE